MQEKFSTEERQKREKRCSDWLRPRTLNLKGGQNTVACDLEHRNRYLEDHRMSSAIYDHHLLINIKFKFTNIGLFAHISILLPKMRIVRFYMIFLLMMFYKCTEGYPQGAPTDACDTVSATRTYGLLNQGNEGPYVLMQTSISYKPGQVINGKYYRKVTIFYLSLNE